MRKLLATATALALISAAWGQTITGGGGGGGGGGSGTVTSVAAACGVSASPAPITTTGTISANVTFRNNTATTDTITSTDCGTVVTESNASSVAVAITTAGFASGNYVTFKNLGAGVATYTPSSGTIGGASTLALAQGQSIDIYFDGTNFITLPGYTGTITIASGTSALGTSLIGSAVCASAVTTSATGVATTDTVQASFNSDPTGSTGYVPLTTGMLTIIPYPTSNNVNFKVCNNTSSSITPSPISLNWRVVR